LALHPEAQSIGLLATELKPSSAARGLQYELYTPYNIRKFRELKGCARGDPKSAWMQVHRTIAKIFISHDCMMYTNSMIPAGAALFNDEVLQYPGKAVALWTGDLDAVPGTQHGRCRDCMDLCLSDSSLGPLCSLGTVYNGQGVEGDIHLASRDMRVPSILTADQSKIRIFYRPYLPSGEKKASFSFWGKFISCARNILIVSKALN